MTFLPSLPACGDPHFSQRAETRAWLDFPQNSGHQVEVEVRAWLWVQGVSSLLPLLCAFQSGLSCLYLLPLLLLTLKHPRPPRRGRELQRSLGKGIQCSHTPRPGSPPSWLILLLAGWDTRLSPPLTLTRVDTGSETEPFILYIYSRTGAQHFS